MIFEYLASFLSVGMTGFEPATTRPPDAYSNRAELHPALFCECKDMHFLQTNKICCQNILCFCFAYSLLRVCLVDYNTGFVKKMNIPFERRCLFCFFANWKLISKR